MSAPTSTLRLLAPLVDWPDVDRTLWKEGLAGPYSVGLKPAMLAAVADGYGGWIGVLCALGQLDEAQRPADRVTPDAVNAFIEALGARGNSTRTVVARLSQLGMALRILEPQRSFTWLHPRKLLRQGAPPPWRLESLWANWPDIDRQIWERGLQPGDILDEPNYAARLRPATLKAVVVGYRRWLAFLREQGSLEPTATPAERVTRAHVSAYFRCLRERYTTASVIARLSELRSALRIMHPDKDFRWLTAPGGRSLASLLPMIAKPIQAIDSKVLYEWGLSMMQDATSEADPEHRRLRYRNGLLIALFAARAPRVRSMASLRLGETVLHNGPAYRLIFGREDIKTGRPLEYDAPVSLTPAIDHYVNVVRAQLVTGRDHGWFWVTQYGERMSQGEIGDMIQRKSAETFGKGFGPHRFRHGMGTTAPLKDPAHPGVAAAVLAISGSMVEQHYNRASQADVAATFHKSLKQARADHQGLAGRSFGWERDA